MTPLSSYAFTLQVPASGDYRSLGPDVAERFIELLGGTKAEAGHFAAALTKAIGALAGTGTGHLELVFATGASGVDVTIHCAGRSSVVRHALPARQS